MYLITWSFLIITKLHVHIIYFFILFEHLEGLLLTYIPDLLFMKKIFLLEFQTNKKLTDFSGEIQQLYDIFFKIYTSIIYC